MFLPEFKCRWIAFSLALVLGLCIVSQLGAQGNNGEFGSQAVSLYKCFFEAEADQNYDQWPDNWTRRRGAGYPQYLEIGIQPSPEDANNRCLVVEMNGGAAHVSTPAIPIASRFSYAVEVDMKVLGLKRDIITLLLTFLDEHKKPLETVETKPIPRDSDWQHVSIRPATPHQLNAKYAVVSVHVRPGEREDLSGRLLIDNLELLRLPQMVVKTNHPNSLFLPGEKVNVSVEISGIVVTDSALSLEVLNAAQQPIKQHVVNLGGAKAELRSSGPDHVDTLASQNWVPWEGTPPEPGFYYVRVALKDKEGNGLQRTIRLAVIAKQPVPKAGEFGWSLPTGERAVASAQLLHILRHAGVNWVKYPVWYGEKETAQAEKIVRMVDQLDELGINTIGLLDQPPAQLTAQLGDQKETPSAIVFAEKNLWMPALDPVLSRLSLKIRWWQLGADEDSSFVGDPALFGKLQDVRTQLVRFGESMRLGIPWKVLQDPPEDFSKAGSFLSYSDRPAPTAQEIIATTPKTNPAQVERWLALHPLRRGDYDSTTRARDLIQRMIAARMQRYSLTFIPRPFDDYEGLFTSDGTPSELFLPWRTAALALATRDYLGSVRLPNGSENHLFSNGEEAVMVLWNEQPTQETMYLGEQITACDMHGTPIKIATNSQDDRVEQILPAGPAPIFIFGVHAKLAQFGMLFEFENSQLQSLLGQAQTVGYKYRNPFARSVAGSFTIHAPSIAETTAPVAFRGAPGELRASQFPLLLKPEAGSGIRPVRIDFQLTADRDYRVSLYREMFVGLQGIDVELDTRVNEEGFLEVRAQLVNSNDKPVSFTCHLFVPERRRHKIQIMNLGSERRSVTFRVPDGRELIGKELVLRFEEVGGSRVMNQQILVHE
jgi:hypothetical protein